MAMERSTRLVLAVVWVAISLAAVASAGQGMEGPPAAEEVDLHLLFAGVAEGDVASTLQLALTYEYGAFGVERDRAKAVQYMRTAVAQGSLEAHVLLADTLRLAPRDGVPRDTKESFRLYGLAAEQGFVDGMLGLANAFLLGIGTRPDPSAAAEAFRDAARAGSAGAMMELASLYYEGLGVEQSYRKAAKLLKGAADAGIAEAQWRLAGLYGTGQGVKPDLNKKFELLLLASDQSHMEATFDLAGMLLDMGHEESAGALLEDNAYRGHTESQFQLALMYQHGVGMRQDSLQAFEWLERAARDGDATAKYTLADFYEEGVVVEKDKRKAIRLRREAEEAATAAAMEEEYLHPQEMAEREERWDSMTYKEMLAELEDAIKQDIMHEMGTLS